MHRIQHILCTLATGCLVLTASAQIQPSAITSQITDVTVFLQGAQVTRFAQPGLQKGENILVLQGLASGIDPNSIQVSAPSNVLINSVVHEVNYLKGLTQPKRVAVLADSLVLLRNNINRNNQESALLESERQLLITNQSLSGDQVGVDVAELEKAANFFRLRMTDINDRVAGLKKKNKDLQDRETKIKQQLNELSASLNRPSNDIVVKLQADAAERIDLKVKYLVGNATWTPGYDIRAKDTQSPIRLDYRADVVQQTGEDWEEVRLTLSSGNPSQGATAPMLSQWNLYAQDPYVYKKRSMEPAAGAVAIMSKSEAAPAEDEGGGEYVEEAVDFDEPSTTLANYTRVEAGATTAEFKILIPQTVKSGDKAQQVSVQSSELPALYRHFAVPKLDKDAFLTARVTGWEKLNLIQGNARIFFEGTYVTEAYLDPALTEDTLSLSLGRDPRVVITRETLKDFNKARIIGLNREKTVAIEIKIKNTKNAPVQLSLEDQVPVSMDKDIIVKVEEISGASLNAETGKLTWDVNLQPGETKAYRIIYSVKHPKNKPVPGI